MNKKLNDKYNPQDFEEKLYQEWEEKGYFKPSMDKTKESYCIMMPPPNVTGKLHMGHALDDTIQDILIRFKRMQGYNTLWLPGSDHAAIATEVKVVAKMKEEEGLTKADITREQMAAILYRYANYKKIDTQVGDNTNILSYDDYNDISEYAIPSMQWAAGSGLMVGKTDITLNPKDNATRAEAAAVFMRFVENFND